MEQKSVLRRSIAEREAKRRACEREDSDRAIARALLALPEWQRAGRIFSYVSVRAETDTRGILRAAFAAGKRVAVPMCSSGGQMQAREIASPDVLVPGRFGLPEPDARTPVAPPESIDLVIAPCVAADRRGFRLGRGGGYYDRYLRLVRCPVICVCRGDALMDALPAEAHDVPVDIIVTELEVLRP